MYVEETCVRKTLALFTLCRVQLKPDGTRWRTGREVKGKLANGLRSQYSSHYLGTWCIQHYYRWCAHLGCQQSTELTPPADLNGLVRFDERRNLVSARVPSHFKRSLPPKVNSDNSALYLQNACNCFIDLRAKIEYFLISWIIGRERERVRVRERAWERERERESVRERAWERERERESERN